MWKTFRTRFNPILESMKRHRALLMDERLNAAVLEIQTGRDQTLRALTESTNQSSTSYNGLQEKVTDIYTKLSLEIYGLAQSSEKIDEALQRSLPLQEMSSLLTKLEPSDYMADQHAALEQCHDQTGIWIFQDPSFLRWIQSRALPDCTLFAHGMPGAGM